MKVLVLTQVLPYPLDAGPKLRAYYELRHLAERGHRLDLLSFVRPDDTPDRVAHLQQFCHAVHTLPMQRSRVKDAAFLARAVLSRRSFIIERDTRPAMHAQMKQLLNAERYDVVHADQLWMAQYAVGCSRVKRVLDQHNAVYLIPQRLAQHEGNALKRLLLKREARLLAQYEAEICCRFDQVVTVTEEDRRALLALCDGRIDGASGAEPVGRMSVIPICVDPQDKPVIARQPNARRILILGTMFWLPNVEGALWFGRQVWPQVAAQVPDARLTIIGKNPPPAVCQLSEADARVEVLGYVADLRSYLEQSALFVVPLHAGGGMRVKILDAWCWGLPIVSTSIGAEGIHVQPGENILIADEAAAFARAVRQVLQDDQLAARLSANGRAWVEQHYDWRRVYRLWDEVYASIGC